MPKEYVLVLGGDLLDETTLGPMTANRVERGVAYTKTHEDVLLYAAAGISPDFPKMEKTMAELMQQHAREEGGDLIVCGRDPDFNTRGELRVFMPVVPEGVKKAVISARWHLSRVHKIIELTWGKEVADSFTYMGVDDPFTLRLRVLETLKWLFLYIPEGWKSGVRGVFHKLFGRSSW